MSRQVRQEKICQHLQTVEKREEVFCGWQGWCGRTCASAKNKKMVHSPGLFCSSPLRGSNTSSVQMHMSYRGDVQFYTFTYWTILTWYPKRVVNCSWVSVVSISSLVAEVTIADWCKHLAWQLRGWKRRQDPFEAPKAHEGIWVKGLEIMMNWPDPCRVTLLTLPWIWTSSWFEIVGCNSFSWCKERTLLQRENMWNHRVLKYPIVKLTIWNNTFSQ